MQSVVPLGFVLLGGVLLFVSSSDAANSQNRHLVRSLCDQLHPVILIPGLGGSRLDVKLHGKTSSPFPCFKKSDEYTIWLDGWTLTEFVHGFEKAAAWLFSRFFKHLVDNLFSQCVVENMKLIYDNVTRTTSSVQGVTLSVPNFGSPYSVDTLYPDTTGFWILDKVAKSLPIETIQKLEYFLHISKALRNLNVSISGAPYDFRKAPNEQKEYFNNLRNLVEDTYFKNGNISVILIAHSMGGPMALQFLYRQTQEWKDKHIKSLVSLSASWGGSVKAMKVFIEGDNFGHPDIISDEAFKPLLTTLPSIVWLLPFRQLWNDTVLVTTTKKNYTLGNMTEFFNDTNETTAGEMYKAVLNYTTNIVPPGVEVHCLYGHTTIPITLEQLRYNGKLGEEPNHVLGEGDGTVNLKSLRDPCIQWSKTQTVHLHPFNVKHLDILKDKEVINYIKRVVRGESFKKVNPKKVKVKKF